jgi:hypothetical protein
VDQTALSFEATKLAFGMAKDLSVQLITLGSALMGLTVVLSKDIKKSHNPWELMLLIAVLFFYLCSIIAGIYTIMKLTGALAPGGGAVDFSLNSGRAPATVQIVTFIIATLLFILYGLIAMSVLSRQADTPLPGVPQDPPVRGPNS